MKKSVKGQNGVELMIVYALVILFLGGAFALLYTMGAFNGIFHQNCARDVRGFSSLNPVDWGVFYSNNEVKVDMRNDVGINVELTGGFVSLGAGVDCSWSPVGQVFMAPGESVTINLTCIPTISSKLFEGSCYAADGTFNFTNSDNGRAGKSVGSFRGEIEKSG